MPDKSVLLINPNRIKPPVAPVALDYLASALHSGGFRAELLDLCFSRDVEEDISHALGGNEYLLIGITFRNTDDVYYVSRDFMVPRLKEVVDAVRRHSDAPIVLGGTGYSIFPERIAGYCGVPFGIWGDGEVPILELAERLARGEDVRGVPGLIYREGDGYRKNPACFLDFSSMPPLGRDWVDNRRYHDEGGMGSFEAGRGCDSGCVFCPEPVIKGRRYRLKPPSDVAGEIESLLSRKVDHFHTCDSEFNLPYDHALEVCRELARRKLGDRIRWYTYLSPLPFDAELARLMVEAGCAGINFGVDSGCDEILEGLGRDFKREDLIRTASICRETGIPFMFDLLIGGPGETEDTLARTIGLMKELSPIRVGINAGVRLYPGLEMADIVVNKESVEGRPDIYGAHPGEEDFFHPTFYVSPALGEGMMDVVERLVGGDRRFFFARQEEVDDNFNYNDNSLLLKAIKEEGYRGAFWDILRKLAGD